MRSHNKTFFRKVSKILVEFNKVFNFEKFVIYVLQKFNRNFICTRCYLYFFTENLTQNVYNFMVNFLHVYHDFDVMTVKS